MTPPGQPPLWLAFAVGSACAKFCATPETWPVFRDWLAQQPAGPPGTRELVAETHAMLVVAAAAREEGV